MALNANDMKDAIIQALKGVNDTATNANKKFGDAVLKYIRENIEINYLWSASNSTGSDPVTAFTATVSGSETLEPSPDFASMILSLSALIKSLVISPPSGFSLSPLTFNSTGVINATKSEENTQDAAMEDLSNHIVSALKTSFVNDVSVSGSHGAYSGSTTKMTIM